jgi:hypothetical protein
MVKPFSSPVLRPNDSRDVFGTPPELFHAHSHEHCAVLVTTAVNQVHRHDHLFTGKRVADFNDQLKSFTAGIEKRAGLASGSLDDEV